MTESLISGNAAMPLSIRATAVVTSAVLRAARQLSIDLKRGRRVDAAVLRSAMQAAFRASDEADVRNWKVAYDVCEAVTVLFLRRHGAAMRVKVTLPAIGLPMLNIELLGFMRDRFESHNDVHEDICWKLRMFDPSSASAAAALANMLEQVVIERIAKREAL